jgi:ribosome assembly protein 1
MASRIATLATTASVDGETPKDLTALESVGLARPQESDAGEVTIASLDSSLVTGFQIAVSSGPLCGEPMRGVGFIVEDLSFRAATAAAEAGNTLGPISSQVISAAKEACRMSFEGSPVRLVEPMYLCEVQVQSDMLGKMYSVLRRRRSKILSEDMREGSTSMFVIRSHLPVVESFGLSEEILTKTSGEAIPQLVFNAFEVLDVDPFFVPTTAEELEEYGEGSGGGIPPNIALKYIEAVRKRKGLATWKKLVEHADKQRTRSKKK